MDDAPPVVALLCTNGMADFLANALVGLRSVGVDASQVVVGCPPDSEPMVRRIVAGIAPEIGVRVLGDEKPALDSYAAFGTEAFTAVSWMKIRFVRDLLAEHDHVVYADLDVAWLRNPLPYLQEVATRFPVALQTEALPRFPPAVCLGFMSFARDPRSIAFLDSALAADADRTRLGHRLEDQATIQQLIDDGHAPLDDVFFLPEALFPVGVSHALMAPDRHDPVPLRGSVEPFVFHANWTIGTDNKRALLEATGTWHAAGVPADGVGAPDITVVYPVFDVRGDEVDRISVWTREQDLDPARYVVTVVTGSRDAEAHRRIRATLRPQDLLLIGSPTGRDADFWNDGAAMSSSPWILFAEGHAVPRTNCLSAILAWIDEHPEADAANCRLVNVGDHRVNLLLGEWFADVQAEWAADETWPRLHRAGFAMRRDVFDEVGPLDPEFGQFAVPLLSSRLHAAGRSVATIPDAVVGHVDLPLMSHHHHDTRDYARGEMMARDRLEDPQFEQYFGSSPVASDVALQPARVVRRSAAGMVRAFIQDPIGNRRCAGWALRLAPQSLVGLDRRLVAMDAVTTVDETLVGRLPLPEGLRRRRFLTAHGRVVRTEQMRWGAEHPGEALPVNPTGSRWEIDEVPSSALVGAHALESVEGAAFRWTQPVFLLRLRVPVGEWVLELETRGVRPALSADHVTIIVGDAAVPSSDVSIDSEGTIRSPLRSVSDSDSVVTVVSRGMRERTSSGRGRSLGLPLFAVAVRRRC